ncbi:YfiT family bacillithiol transferase [Flavobacterium hauense]
MSNNDIEELRFPIGKFKAPENYTDFILSDYIKTLSNFPEAIKKETAYLSDEQLDTPYRAGGWTIRQVVHHCADSHLNSYIRFKLALTEDNPTIKAYQEDKWAELEDGRTLPVLHSLNILEGLHFRWVTLLKSLSKEDLKVTFIHPEGNQKIEIVENISFYAWHCNHHLAHITELKKRKGW